MAKYKAKVFKVQVKQLESDTPKLKKGDYLVEVVWKPSHIQNYEQWVEIPEPVGDEKIQWLSKAYFLGDVVVGQPPNQKTMTQMAKENMEADFEYNGSSSELETIIGYENELVTETVNGYEQVKFVNNPNRKAVIFAKSDRDGFADIWDK